MMATHDEVHYQKRGRVGILTIARPERRNTVNRHVARALYDLVARAADDDIAVLVFRGEGRDFCCGADVEPGDDADLPAATQIDMKQFEVTRLLHEMPAVSIAAIRGGCAGAGFAWACACDFRISDDTARFNTAFLDMGVAGDMGGPWLLSRMIGGAKARELYFFPQKIDAIEALRIGVTTRMYAADAFERELENMTDRLAAAAPLALRVLKANFTEAERTDLASFITIESMHHLHLYYSEDRAEAFKAYVEKRKPIFAGR